MGSTNPKFFTPSASQLANLCMERVMAEEIERKFLVKDDSWRSNVRKSVPIQQGYLEVLHGTTVRARVKGEQAFLTVKGPSQGVSRLEFEYEIPVEDAAEMIADLCGTRRIKKTRHFVDVGGFEWVIDVFEDHNAPLVLAEVELESEDQAFEMPVWAGAEVSTDAAYFNVNLAKV